MYNLYHPVYVTFLDVCNIYPQLILFVQKLNFIGDVSGEIIKPIIQYNFIKKHVRQQTILKNIPDVIGTQSKTSCTVVFLLKPVCYRNWLMMKCAQHM